MPGLASEGAIGKDGTIYFGDDSGTAYALDATGALLWSYPTGDRIYEAPSVGIDGTLYVQTAYGGLFAVHPGGLLAWKAPSESRVPAIAADGTIYVASAGNLVALDEDGSTRWTFPIGSADLAEPVIDALGTVYVGSQDDGLHAIDAKGVVLWSAPMASIFFGASIGPDGTLYVPSDDGHLYAFAP